MKRLTALDYLFLVIAGALAHKRRYGERVGTIPYGYRLDDDGVALLPVEAEQAVVREMVAMRQAGRSYPAIARELTRRGIPTKQGNATWTHQAVASIVKRAAETSPERSG